MGEETDIRQSAARDFLCKRLAENPTMKNVTSGAEKLVIDTIYPYIQPAYLDKFSRGKGAGEGPGRGEITSQIRAVCSALFLLGQQLISESIEGAPPRAGRRLKFRSQKCQTIFHRDYVLNRYGGGSIRPSRAGDEMARLRAELCRLKKANEEAMALLEELTDPEREDGE